MHVSKTLLLCIGMFMLMPLFGLSSLEGESREVYTFQPYFKHFSTEDGLPSSVVHEVFQDSKNNLWFCTENGISRYNGHDFKNYGEEEGLCLSATIFGHEMENGEIWFFSAHTRVFVYLPSRDEVVCPSFSGLIEQQLRQREIQRLTSYKDTVYIISKKKSVCRLVYDAEQDTAVWLDVKEYADDPEFLRFGDDEYLFLGNYNVEDMQALAGPGDYSDEQFKFYSHARPITINAGDDYVFGLGRFIFLLDSNLKVKDYLVTSHELIGHLLYEEERNTVLAGTFFGGVLEVDLDSFEIRRNLLDGHTITCSFRDHEGGYWFSTHEHGVYYYPPRGVELAVNESGDNLLYPVTINGFNDTLGFVGTKHGDLYSMHSRLPDRLIYRQRFSKEIGDVKPFLRHKDKATVYTLGSPVIDIQDFSILSNDGIRGHFPIGGGEIVVLRKDKGDLVLNDTNGAFVKVVVQNWGGPGIRMTFPLDTCRCYIATPLTMSLYNYCEEKMEVIDFTDKDDTSKTSIVERQTIHLTGDTILVATSYRGLFLIHEDQVIRHFTKGDGLISNSIRELIKSEDGSCWLGTDAGIQQFRVKGESIKMLMELRPETGYPFNLVKRLAIFGNRLLVATESSLYRVPISLTPDAGVQCNRLEVAKVSSHDRKVEPDEDGVFIFPPDFGTIIVELSNVCFVNSGSHAKRYRIADIDTNWTTILSNRVVVQGVPAGNYEVELQVMDLTGRWRESEESARIKVLHPFYLRWWFILTVLLLLGSGAGALLYQRTVMVANKSRFQMGLSEAKNRALGAQLNPHFLYNVLNTVGGSVARNNVPESLEVIGKFSSLMRMVFHNSQSDLISLEAELIAVESYIELELVRLEYRFDFELINTVDEYESLLVPPLLLQPILENAIWHGIAESDDPGHLELEVKQEDQLLCLSIKNTGKAAETDLMEHVGKGRNSSLKLIKERLLLLKKIYGSSAQLSFSSSDKWSTVATFKLPLVRKAKDEA